MARQPTDRLPMGTLAGIHSQALPALKSILKESDPTMKHTLQNCLVEWSYTSGKAYRDPFNEVELDVVFTDPDGQELTVPAFWAGGETWRVRYASPKVGQHRCRTLCSDPADADLHGREDVLEVRPYTGEEPLLRHGPLAGQREPPPPGAPRWYALLLAGRHLVDGPVPAAELARTISRRWPPTASPRASPSSRSWPASTPTCSRSTSAAPTRPASPGTETTRASTPPTSTWPTCASR